MKTYLESISVEGFRAYLAEQTFKLGPNKSLAVFAPNAKGKSSLIDAVEFFFSPAGTLSRLGERRSGTHAGPEALEHVLAEKKKITPRVILKFCSGKNIVEDERIVTRPPSPLPKSAQSVLQLCKHDFIIRGYELRRFVESQTPEDRYKEVSAWFGLTPLLVIQKNLRALRRRVKELAESDQKITLRLDDLRKATKSGVTAWSEANVMTWLNDSVLKVLDKTLSIKTLSKEDPAYKAVIKRKSEEADSLGLTALNQLRDAAHAIYVSTDEGEGGATVDFEDAFKSHKGAADLEAKERVKAANSAFNEIWSEAQKIFVDKGIALKTCPVCNTALKDSGKGSREHVALHIKGSLEGLAIYNGALSKLKEADRTLQRAYAKLKSSKDAFVMLLRAGKMKGEEESLKTYFSALDNWKSGQQPPSSVNARKALQKVAHDAAAKAKSIQSQQGGNTYAGALSKLDELLKIRDAIREAMQEKTELATLHQRLEASALQIDKEIASYIASLLNGLKDEINRIYIKIQGPGANAPSIRIEPPDPEDRGQLRLNLVVDFAENRKGVIPSGYFSDSQVHTLALSLRLSALKLFNKDVPIGILDDVVTSYDADHRKAIASLLAEDFPEFQFVVVTHDERFFVYLKEHLPPANWTFRQITHLEDNFGPRYIHHRITTEIVEDKFKKGEPAANEIRRAEEEWLLLKAREFGIDLRIRDIDKPYAYDRGELAVALATFLKSKKIETPVVAGLSNSFWESLQKGSVENFGSHFQDNPGASWSSGDEKKRWAEFIAFRDLFACPSCGHKKFKRPKIGVERPLCAKCETPFSFVKPSGT